MGGAALIDAHRNRRRTRLFHICAPADCGSGRRGAKTVDALFDELFSSDAQIQAKPSNLTQLWDQHRRIVDALAATRQDVFWPILIAKGQTTDSRRIGLLADLLVCHGRESGGNKSPISTAYHLELRDLIERWIETLCSANPLDRSAASEVASAAGRLADASLAEPLARLNERDLDARDAQRMIYTRMYTAAFAAMRDTAAVMV